MDFIAFKRTLETFADKPVDINISKGSLLAQIREELIEASISIDEGSVVVTENGERYSGERWIIDRIARVRILADRILDHIQPEAHFVIPSGKLLDAPDLTETGDEVGEENSLDACRKVLERRLAGTSSLLYLTSDAGEGKTTLINQMARKQAEDYKAKKTNWLLLPISLGGRPFMRLDEVVIAAIVNRFRFQNLYFESFLELVRMGIIVPALDGFEEMFIESASGDAMSALGNLVQMLESSGSVLIAARKAYFDYNSLASSSRLFDALAGRSVTFSKLTLDRWSKAQFLSYSGKRGVSQGEIIYADVSKKLNVNHPLLTRAVLVKRLLDVATTVGDRKVLLTKLEAGPRLFFSQFVAAIVEREAAEKWINKAGEPPTPLLTLDEHYELLSMLAQEMWGAGRSSIGIDLMDTVATLFCDKYRKSVVESRQIIERLKQHALIMEETSGKKLYAFDHEEFFHYFLGESLFHILKSGTDADLRTLFRPKAMPALALETAVSRILAAKLSIEDISGRMTAACKSDAAASFVGENAGGFLIRLMDGTEHGAVRIDRTSFPADALGGREIKNLEFSNCYFQQTSFPKTIENCTFHDSELERIRFVAGGQIKKTNFIDCRIHAIQNIDSDVSIFDPDQIGAHLKAMGISWKEGQIDKPLPKAVSPDEDVILTERVLRVFLRSTRISDYHLGNRLGKGGARFFKSVLSQLTKARVLVESDYHGAVDFKYYQLGMPMSDINSALEASGGDFKRFLLACTNR